MPKSKGHCRSFAKSSKTSLKARAPIEGTGPRRGPPREAIAARSGQRAACNVIVYLILYTLYMEYCVLYLLAVFQAVLTVYCS